MNQEGAAAAGGRSVLIGFVTAPPDDAGRIAAALVEGGVAACCNVVPSVTSIFRWRGKSEAEAEALIVLKTTGERASELVSMVKDIHPYDLPEVVFVQVAGGLEGYLKWVQSECTR